VQIPDGVRREVLEFARELDGQRLHCGSWVEEHPTLRSVIVTQQALLLFAAIDPEIFATSLDRGVRWLCGPEILTAQGAQWRPLPLLHAGATNSQVQAALEFTRGHVSGNVRPDPNTPLDAFYVEACARSGALDDTAVGILARWAEDLSPEALPGSGNGVGGWKPNRVTHTIAAAALAGELDEEVAVESLRLVEAAAAKPSSQRCYWENLNMTAYTVLNLLHFREARQGQPPGEADAIADRLIDAGLCYVVRRWEEDDFESDSIAGGGPDFINTPFQKVVSARVVVTALNRSQPGWPGWTLAEAVDGGSEAPAASGRLLESKLNVWLVLVSLVASIWQLLTGALWLGGGLIAATAAAAVCHERLRRWPPPGKEVALVVACGVVVALAVIGAETIL
jgi:hypothetical protein